MRLIPSFWRSSPTAWMRFVDTFDYAPMDQCTILAMALHGRPSSATVPACCCRATCSCLSSSTTRLGLCSVVKPVDEEVRHHQAAHEYDAHAPGYASLSGRAAPCGRTVYALESAFQVLDARQHQDAAVLSGASCRPQLWGCTSGGLLLPGKRALWATPRGRAPPPPPSSSPGEPVCHGPQTSATGQWNVTIGASMGAQQGTLDDGGRRQPARACRCRSPKPWSCASSPAASRHGRRTRKAHRPQWPSWEPEFRRRGERR